MEKKEAIEYLIDVRNGIHIPSPGRELPLLNEQEKKAIDLAISALEKQEADRWHSVAKEGNPKEAGHYIVVDKNPTNGNKPHIRYFNAYGDASFWSGWKADDVIAWKEITSEPYKAEDEA